MPGISPDKGSRASFILRRALRNELLLRALTGTSFFTTSDGNRLVWIPVIGGLHHRYIRVAA